MNSLNHNVPVVKNCVLDPQLSPSVTIAIPVKNEAANIEFVIRGFLASIYPNIVEILVADSGSTDDTQAIVEALSRSFPTVHYMRNTVGLRASGLNLMLAQAKGDIFLRADAHAVYAADYVECCIATLLATKAKNVGGAQRAIAKTAFQTGVALAYRSVWTSGRAKYRNSDYDGYVDTVYLGCFWRQDLLQIAGYSLEIPSEDAELNLRLNQTDVLQDGSSHRFLPSKNQLSCVYISSKIKVWYYPRQTWLSLWLQYFNYGRGRFLLITKYHWHLQLRGIMPFSCLSLMVLLTILDLSIFGVNSISIRLIALVLLLIFLESSYLNIQFTKIIKTEIWQNSQQPIPPLWIRHYYCSIAVLTMPLAHACGYAYQLWRRIVLGIQTW